MKKKLNMRARRDLLINLLILKKCTRNPTLLNFFFKLYFYMQFLVIFQNTNRAYLTYNDKNSFAQNRKILSTKMMELFDFEIL